MRTLRHPIILSDSATRLTELLLLEDADQEGIREIVTADIGKIEFAVQKAATDLRFYTSTESLTIDDKEIESASVTDIWIVGLGDDECTVTFDVELECRFGISWEEIDDPNEGSYSLRHDWARETVQIGGTAKVGLDRKHSVITDIRFFEVDQSDIPVAPRPNQYYRNW